MVESGIFPVEHVMAKKRKNFLDSKFRAPNDEEPFHIVFKLCREENTPGYRFLLQAMQYNSQVNPLENIINIVQEKPLTASKYITYRTQLNPELCVHKIYVTKAYIPDYKLKL